uniref:Neutrophil elastase n=1 Tax=Lygus hesperus TaxID=30085 RepID=A0A0A9XNY1_LYGHE
MVYEEWYADTVHLPPINRYGPSDFPSYLDLVGRLHNRKRKINDPLMYRVHYRVYHPLLNSMAIFAGHTEVIDKAPQRRHAASFFPHHLCAERHVRIFPDYWELGEYDLDIGLVKSCFPFTLNDVVTVAPLPKYEDMEKKYTQLIHQSITCLVVGWGKILKPHHLWSAAEVLEGYADIDPRVLHHAFRYSDCTESCRGGKQVCTVCTSHHGPEFNSLGHGDSGGPLICNGLVLAVNSAGGFNYTRNHTYASHIALACIKDYITPQHLNFLSSKKDNRFHWIDGQPVTKGPGP